MLPDLRVGLRLSVRQWGSSVAIIVIIGLSIGCGATVFSFARTALAPQLPYADAHRLVGIHEITRSGSSTGVRANLLAQIEGLTALESAAALRYGGGGTLLGGSEPERALGVFVSPNFFQTLGVQPLLGRQFTESENRQSAVLSHGLWARSFGSDPTIIGKPLRLDGEQITPVAVLQDNFWFSNRQIEVWRPLELQPEQLADQRRLLTIVARLAPSATVEDAQWEAARLARLSAGGSSETALLVEHFPESINRSLRRTATTLNWSVALLVIVAVGNLTGLLLSRGLHRAKEFGVRIAMGARLSHLFGQVVAESLVLAAIGCVLGLALAWAGTQTIPALIPDGYRAQIADVAGFGLGLWELFFAGALASAVLVLASVIPALKVSRARVHRPLQTDGRNATRSALGLEPIVSGQIAISLVLLAATAALLLQLLQLRSRDVGFHGENVLTMRLFLAKQYGQDGDRLARYQDEIVRLVGSLPGVGQVAFVSYLPTGDSGRRPFDVVGTGNEVSGNLFSISSGAFDVLGIPIERGRDFDTSDLASPRGVAIISSSLAASAWPNQGPIGRHLLAEAVSAEPLEVIGVVGDVRSRLTNRAIPIVYLPYRQRPAGTILLTRTSGNPTSYARDVLGKVWSVDPDQPVRWIAPLNQFDIESLWQRELSMVILAILAMAAVALSVLGVYGIMVRYVQSRRREIGIRLALGATSQNLQWLVLKRAGLIAVAGIVAGLGVSVLVNSMVEGYLYDAKLADMRLLLGIAVLLIVVSFAASYPSVRRTTLLGPGVSLRME